MIIEQVVREHLTKCLRVPVYLERPKEAPKEWILIEKTADGRENFISSPTLAIQSYSTSLYKAAELNERVKIAMDRIIVLSEIAASNLNTDYNFTDSETKEYRYQAVYDLKY